MGTKFPRHRSEKILRVQDLSPLVHGLPLSSPPASIPDETTFVFHSSGTAVLFQSPKQNSYFTVAASSRSLKLMPPCMLFGNAARSPRSIETPGIQIIFAMNAIDGGPTSVSLAYTCWLASSVSALDPGARQRSAANFISKSTIQTAPSRRPRNSSAKATVRAPASRFQPTATLFFRI